MTLEIRNIQEFLYAKSCDQHPRKLAEEWQAAHSHVQQALPSTASRQLSLQHQRVPDALLRAHEALPPVWRRGLRRHRPGLDSRHAEHHPATPPPRDSRSTAAAAAAGTQPARADLCAQAAYAQHPRCDDGDAQHAQPLQRVPDALQRAHEAHPPVWRRGLRRHRPGLDSRHAESHHVTPPPRESKSTAAATATAARTQPTRVDLGVREAYAQRYRPELWRRRAR